MNGYKEWYVNTPAGEAALRKAIADDPTYAEGVQKRLDEMKQVPDMRCSITKTQIEFLTRVLGSL